ncbi:MAG: hypothetical protein CVU52_04010 [Deltaproteobacteria bacterium HGW-Deltaproteobacteria-10]|nr:MAG: hypothetical protein CVU52_04010 [Deltaproteobacteria bacterium HGW-Deltaproteobacteria-10]
MRLTNKLIIIPVVFISWAGMAYADDPGLLFDWQPFVVKSYLELKQPWNNNFPENLSAYKEMREQYDYIDNLFQSDVKTINDSPDLNIKKSPLSNIKVTFSAVNSFMLPADEISSRGKDGKLSTATRTLPSLFRNPSPEITLETIKLIEPQINLGFEF